MILVLKQINKKEEKEKGMIILLMKERHIWMRFEEVSNQFWLA